MNVRAEVTAINIFLMLAGLWLMITAIVFQYHIGGVRFGYHIGSPPQVNEFFVGAFIFVIALICAVNPSASSWLSWVNVALGIWLILSPYLLGYTNLEVARWNENILGIIVVGLGIWSAWESRGQPTARRAEELGDRHRADTSERVNLGFRLILAGILLILLGFVGALSGFPPAVVVGILGILALIFGIVELVVGFLTPRSPAA